jgi:Domain of unknown function (DUF4388)
VKRLLIVVPDEVRRQTLAVLAGSEGLEVISASSSLQALTQLERNPPDVILCDDQPGDLSVAEFHEIVRSGAGSLYTPMLFLTDDPPLWLDARLDMSAPRSRTSRELIATLIDTTITLVNDPFRLNPLTQAPNLARMGGTLEIVSLFDLLVSFNQIRKTGRIIVKVGSDEVLIYLLRGEVWHVEYGGNYGQEALMQAFVDTDVAPTSSFAFTITQEQLVSSLPKTVTLFTSRLLLEIAVHLDHVRSDAETSQTA